MKLNERIKWMIYGVVVFNVLVWTYEVAKSLYYEYTEERMPGQWYAC